MNDFKIRSVHESVLDSETRKQIDPGPEGDKKGFYASNKWFIWACVIALSIIGVLVYLVFFSTSNLNSEPAKVALVIETPSTVEAGSELVYKIRIENQDTKTLSSGQLEVVLPEGGSFLQSTPPALNSLGTLYSVPELVSGQNVVIFVKVKIQGGVGDTKQLLAKYHYRFSGVSSEFVKEASSNLQLNASDIAIEWDGPVSTNNSQLVIYNLTYRNSSNKDVNGSRVQIEFPNGFNVSSTSPAADISSNTWNIGKLSAGQEGKITIQGSFTGASTGEIKNISANFLILGDSGSYLNQGSSSFSTTISSSPLALSVVAENKSNNIVKPGDHPNFIVKYANNATSAVSSVNISVSLDSKSVDIGSLTSDGGIVSGNTITWNASSSGKLENLAPSENGEFRFSFFVKNPPVKDNSKNLQINITSKVTAQEYSSPFPGNSLSLKIGTVVGFDANITNVSGRTPPKVGATTTYQIQFSVRNTTNDISDGVVTAYLPIDPKSFDKSSIPPKDSGNVRFDPATGKLTWQIGTVSSGSGSFIPPKVLTFKLNLVPVASQANKPVQLLKNIVFTGKDSFTGEELSLSTEPVSTQDAGDNSGGTVEP